MNNFIEPPAASPSIGDAGRINMQNIDQFFVPRFEKRSSVAATHLPLPLQHLFPVSPVVPPSVVTAVGPEVESPQPSRSRMAQMEIYWSGIATVNKTMTRDITKTDNSLNNSNNGSLLCAGCGKHIKDRYLLRALDRLWHQNCLKCGCCDCRLGEVGSTLYKTGKLMLCKLDYFRLFGNTGYCAACSKLIFAYEMVMRARTNVYHLDCFACQQCNHRLCVGDRFYLCKNKILCEYDYEKCLLFATMAAGVPGAAGGLPGGGPGVANMGVSVGMVNSPRTPGDHNNNKGPQTPTGGGSPLAAAATAAAEEPARGVQTKKSPGHGRA
ncbi:LIM/homeobox protein Lhx2-like [Drosophila miranda]|uniref:LIM/homeobox protein Lhx2-like n=1 Tax=Drosophila miranda TaxID=7229 RepID=UPI0007E628B4|nr:LIM/homeobox protein Lhx2-like [Drosophila miranda]XP_033249984.1 LIM/homeobox protein Lhx2-like [Drosophila miranda]